MSTIFFSNSWLSLFGITKIVFLDLCKDTTFLNQLTALKELKESLIMQLK